MAWRRTTTTTCSTTCTCRRLSTRARRLIRRAVTPQQALAAATRTGALSQGREDCGIVAAGARADLCVLDTTGPSWCPAPDPVYNVVYAGDGADVVLTMCDGEVIYRAGEWPTIDVERAKAECVARTARIISEL